MKRYGLLFVLLLISVVFLTAGTVYSVKAQDSGNASSRIVIKTSDPAGYSFSDRQGTITVSIPKAELATQMADWRRLSHVIDYISLAQDNANAYVTIKTMGDFNVSHYSSGTSIIVDVVNPAIKAPVTERPTPQTTKVVTPQPPKATPKPIDKPTSPEAKQAVEPATPAQPESLKPELVKVPYTIKKIPFWDNMAMAIEPNLELYGVMLFLMLTILIILIYPKGKPAEKQKKAVPDLGLNGATLIMDSETKVRMVTTLLNDGWTSRQIAKEMKLPLKEVEMLVSRAQISDHTKH